MKDFCQFLRFKEKNEPVCLIGINFYSVGKLREVCRVCPLANLGDVPGCENLDVFAYQDWRPEGCAIRVEASCYLKDDTPSGNRCSNCPESEQLIITTPAEAMRLVCSALQKDIL